MCIRVSVCRPFVFGEGVVSEMDRSPRRLRKGPDPSVRLPAPAPRLDEQVSARAHSSFSLSLYGAL